MKDQGFLQRVRTNLSQLHPTERRLAEFLLNFPGELASYTAAELARLAHVSAATVSRFVQKLGYANYEEARRHVRAEQRSGAALFMAGSQPQEPEAALQAHLQQAQANLEKTFRSISQAEIDRLARAILGARRVWVIGFRTSQSFAAYLQWQIFQVCPQSAVVPQAGHTLAEYVASIDAADCVVIFGLARRVRALDPLLGQIAQTGAQVAYITDEAVVRRDDLAWHFRCQTLAPGPLFTHVAVMALAHLIATRVIEISGPEGRKRMSVIESLHDSLTEL